MITGWQEDLQSTLRKREPLELAASLLELYRSSGSLSEFVAQCAAAVALTLYREEYPRFVPHSLMGFIGALQLSRLVRPEDHALSGSHPSSLRIGFRALAQALWYHAQEGVREPYEWTGRAVELPPDRESLEERLEVHLGEKRFEEFFSLILAGLEGEQRREAVLSWLLRTAGRDLFNLGHKHLYLAKSVALLDYLRWERPEVYLFPAVHYLMFGPEDRRAEGQLEQRLTHYGLRLKDRSFDRFDLSIEETLQIRDSITGDSAEGVLDTLLGAFEYGVAPGALAEALLVTAAHLVLAIPYERWIFSVHGFNYTETVRATLDYHRGAEQQRMLLLNGLFLKQVVEMAAPVEVREPFFTARPEAARPLPTDLEEAIDLSIPADAMAVVDWLYQHGQLSPERLEALALAAIKSDGNLHFGHDMKFAYAALEAFQSSSTPLRESFLLALAKFLAESEKSRQFDHALAKVLRA